jgi:hypothetical protein
MKITRQDIGRLEKAAKDFIRKHPSGKILEYDVLGMGSGDETVVLLTLEELEGNSTICGSNNTVDFTSNVIAFLKSQGVENVLVGVIGPEAVQDTDDEIGLIAGGAVPIPFEGSVVDDWRDWFPNGNQYISEMVADGRVPSPAEVLSEMISENGGSWRADNCNVEGWSTYESE